MKTKVSVQTKKVLFDAAPELYGLFFEDINRAADGGLYPEMIRNRAFEDSLPPAGCRVTPGGEVFINEGGWPGSFMNGEGMDEWAKRVDPTPVPGWYARGADIQMNTADPLNPNRLAALDVRFERDGTLYNVGYGGIAVKAGEKYAFCFFASADRDACLKAGFYDSEGACLGEGTVKLSAGAGYKRYDLVITALRSGDGVRFGLTAGEELFLRLGFTSLMPTDTYLGHGLRTDLVMALKDTHSRFIRFPGGCVVEGINEENAVSFSRTLGPVWERPSSFLMWHYRTTNGLGYHEYLQLCEDLGMAAMYVCNCGISGQARHGRSFDDETTEWYLEEALHAAEYALGDTDTEYGALRAANGHRGPFPLKYLEIGNENFGPEYNARYRRFYDALKKAFPGLILIANAHVERAGLPAQMVDEHYYDTPEYFVEHRHLFDGYDRKGPKIFIGEYAVNGGGTIASLECALAEAVFLTGVEKNQDIVRLSAYAPLFQNSDYTAWLPNLIVFDRTRRYGIPTWHVISLLAKYRGTQVIASDSRGDAVPPRYAGIPGIMCKKGGLLFKNVTVNGKPAPVSKKIYGDIREEGDAFRMVRTAATHRYIGKNEVWNREFERFIGAGPGTEDPVVWVCFGEERMEKCVFEADLKFGRDEQVTLSVWNHDPRTEAGCNEPRDRDWNMRTIRNRVFRIEDGRIMCRAPRFFDPPLEEREVRPIEPSYDRFDHFRIEAEPGCCRCFINGQLVMENVLPLLPLVSDAASMDDEHIYLKLVNIGEEAQEAEVCLDCEVEEAYTAAVVSGRPEDVNSFEAPERICAREEALTGAGRRFTHTLPPFSVCVLVLKRKR